MEKQKSKTKQTRNTQVVEPIRDKHDIKRIIDYFNTHDKHKYAVLFELGVNSGLRVSDLLKFKVKDVLNKSQLALREKKTHKAKVSSRVKARRVSSYCHSYIKNGGTVHKEFALNVLELLNA